MIIHPEFEKYDVAVIGAGPGGYTAAIRAAQLGARVVLIEEKKLGGTCTNVGCIPTKTLLRSIKLFEEVKQANNSGQLIGEVRIDLLKLMKRKDDVVTKLSQGIEFLLQRNGINTIFGRGILIQDKKIEVVLDGGGKQIIEASKIILATGSKPSKPPIPGLEGDNVIFDEEASNFSKIPTKLGIAGGGPQGIEFACMYSKLGAKVTILEMMSRILPAEDFEIAQYLHKKLVESGVSIETNAKVTSIENSKEHKLIRINHEGQEKTLEVDKVLITFGRKPYSENLGLEDVGVKIIDGRILVNEKMETSVADVFAIGDVIGGAYAHEAMKGGIVAAENAIGAKKENDSILDRCTIPRSFFTIPQVAAVGLTEEEAKKQEFDVKIGKFYFASNAGASTLGETDGFIKIVTDGKLQEILGVHIIGPNASELIAEATLAIKMEATLEDVIDTIHAHPTLSEAFLEAAMDVDGRSIHKFKKKVMSAREF